MRPDVYLYDPSASWRVLRYEMRRRRDRRRAVAWLLARGVFLTGAMSYLAWDLFVR